MTEQWQNELECRLGELILEHPLVLGAGAAKHIDTEEGLEGFSKDTEASLLIGGTITYYPRSGNPGTVFYHEPHDCRKVINWMGMPNQGITEIITHLTPIVQLAHRRNQLIGVSVAGTVEAEMELSIEEQFYQLTKACLENGANLVELNFGCPNTEKSPISFSPESIREILSQLESFGQSNVCVKLSPYEDFGLMREVAAILNSYDVVKGVATMNTIPNQQWILPNGKPTIDRNNGYGGLSGECIFPIAIRQVEKWRTYLSPQKYIIGGGGVTTANSVREMLEAGANAAFMVSAPLVLGHKIFGKILNELLDEYA